MGQGDQNASSAYEHELERGHGWLRFSPSIESEFQLDTSTQRFKHLIVGFIIGQVSLWIGIANERKVLPDSIEQAMPIWVALTALILMAIAGCALMGPRRMSRHWRMDWVGCLGALSISACIIWVTNTSTTLTATVHASYLVLISMWVCILCRLRFHISLAANLVNVLIYVWGAKAPSLVQQEIHHSNTKILLLTTAFALTVNYLLDYQERRTYLRRKVEAQQRDALAQAQERLRLLSMLDPLTGLHNRRQFEADFELLWTRSQAQQQAMGLLMVDVDYFKAFNDTYGHPAGDVCLKTVAEVLQQVAGELDGHAARLGGEEFALLLPAHGPHELERAGLLVRSRLQAAGLEHRASSVSHLVTASLGGASIRAQAQQAPSTALALMMRDADAALYEAKASGRDQVMVQPLLVDIQTAQASPSGSLASPGAATTALDPMAQLSAVIQSKFRGLRFPKELETPYQAARVEARRKHLTISGLTGLVAFILYGQTDIRLIDDVAPWLRQWQLIVSVPLLIGVGFLTLSIKPWLRELLYALGVCAMSLVATLAIAQSQLMTAYAGYISVFLIPMFGCVAARQPFWYTAIPSLFTVGLVLNVMHASTPIEQVMRWDVSMMLLTATFFIMLASYSMEHGERMDTLLEKMSVAQRDALAAAVLSLHKLTSTDPLTGINNRRQFEAELQQAWAQHPEQPLSMLILDVDHFKLYNDGYGHPAGDACLTRIASLLKECASTLGLQAFRLGGEEFSILLPAQHAKKALQLGEEVCQAIHRAALPHAYSKVAQYVTVSIGAATIEAKPEASPSDLLSVADQALYLAKSNGRNRVMTSGMSSASP